MMVMLGAPGGSVGKDGGTPALGNASHAAPAAKIAATTVAPVLSVVVMVIGSLLVLEANSVKLVAKYVSVHDVLLSLRTRVVAVAAKSMPQVDEPSNVLHGTTISRLLWVAAMTVGRLVVVRRLIAERQE